VFKPYEMTRSPQSADADSQNIFETTDFYLACFLRCDGFRLVGVRRDGPRSVFQFANRADCRAAMLDFFDNEGTVRPLAFAATIKDLKALIHNL
jgi:hypothetical protein